MTLEQSKKVDAAIVQYRQSGMTFGDVAVEVNTRFETNLTKSAVGARYKRATGVKYPGGHVRRDGRGKKLKLYPRQTEPNIPVDAVYQNIPKDKVFSLLPGMNYHSMTELREHTCRWPLEDANGRTFFCGQPIVNHHSYCPFHHSKAKQ